jgi:hypothetical protein
MIARSPGGVQSPRSDRPRRSPWESCLTDRETGMEHVRVSIDAAAKRVTAGMPLVASASATYTPGLGGIDR